jgi:class 3 adenylate cyclase
MAFAVQEFRLERDVALSREQAWHLLSNTDHLNRAIGLPEVLFEPLPDDLTILYREARARLGGVPMRYREYPFNWVVNAEYSIRRVFESGPLAEITGGIKLSDSQVLEGGTLLEITARILPGNALGIALAQVVGGNSLRKTWKYVRDHIEAQFGPQSFEPAQAAQDKDALAPAEAVPLASTSSAPESASAPSPNSLPGEGSGSELVQSQALGSQGLPRPLRAPNVDMSALKIVVRKLAAMPRDPRRPRLDGPTIARLAEWVGTRGDDEVASLRPFRLAREWGVDEDQALRVFLYATRAGLLNLSWNLMCPNCRVSKSDEEHLDQVGSPFHCDACGIEYSANFDRYIELRFRPAPSIRAVNASEYCIGGPFVTPHVLVQHLIEPGQTHTLPVPASPSSLRLRVFRLNHAVELREEAPAIDRLVYAPGGWEQASVAPRDGNVTVENASGHDILVVIEKEEWDALAVTAARVTTLNEFRDLFGSEVLAPGQSVSIESLTLFFSDLRDSTAMYEYAGDSSAFGRVRAHFDFVTRHVEANRGAVVKTIGDAVMAAFASPGDAVRAAIQMQEHIGEFNREHFAQIDDEGEAPAVERSQFENEGRHPFILKIGLHHGPAIAVNSNARLDYFGRTVNLASRIQTASRGGDVVVSGEVFERNDVRRAIAEAGARVQPFQGNLKGIEDVVEMYRISPAK